MSWKAEVIADIDGKWVPNGMRWATKAEAEQYAFALSLRWAAVRDWRVVESDDPVTEGGHRPEADWIAKGKFSRFIDLPPAPERKPRTITVKVEDAREKPRTITVNLKPGKEPQ